MSSIIVDLVPEPSEYVPDSSATAITVDLHDPTAVLIVDLGDPMAGAIVDLSPEPAEDIADAIASAVIVDALPGKPDLLVPGGSPAITVEVGGCVGPPGPPGPPGEGGFFRWHQAIASDVWLIEHDLGFFPGVTTTDTAGTQLFGDVAYIDEATLTVTFGRAISGYANLS